MLIILGIWLPLGDKYENLSWHCRKDRESTQDKIIPPSECLGGSSLVRGAEAISFRDNIPIMLSNTNRATWPYVHIDVILISVIPFTENHKGNWRIKAEDEIASSFVCNFPHSRNEAEKQRTQILLWVKAIILFRNESQCAPVWEQLMMWIPQLCCWFSFVWFWAYSSTQ